MALSKNYSATRFDIGTAATIDSPQTRGLVFNGQQIEATLLTKLTGDTTGNVTLIGVQRPTAAFLMIIEDSAGAVVSTPAITTVTFTRTSDTVQALSGLGNWTRAIVFWTGRDAKFS